MRDTTEIKVRLALIRHGKTKGNEEGRYIGCRTDAELSEAGFQELTDVKPEIAGILDDSVLVFTSPMRRCKDSALVLFANKSIRKAIAAHEPARMDAVFESWENLEFEDLPEVECFKELSEIDFGRFEGHNFEELKDDADYQAWVDSGGKTAFPEGESREVFIERSMKGFSCMISSIKREVDACIISDIISEDDNLIEIGCTAVLHGGNIMAIMSSLTELDYFDAQTANGTGYLLEFLIKKGNISEISYSRIPDGVHS